MSEAAHVFVGLWGYELSIKTRLPGTHRHSFQVRHDPIDVLVQTLLLVRIQS
jgi:hypothetical protein